ncbi:MAG: SDR family oxidoreductase [Bryobacteraceae bacterium]|nr:SDR family oxidoreductase [Bryobacteraceae bacterium]
MAKRLEGKSVLITGAASGIGRAAAQWCGAEGARVLALDRSREAVESVAAAIRESGGSAGPLPCDVTDTAAVTAAFSGITKLDGLVTSAGIAVRLPLAEQDEAGWDAVINVNLRGVFLCSKQALKRMGRGASIVHIGSGVGITGTRNRAAYTASKGAIVALTRNMALDYAPKGIRVNCVCPGFARTGLTAGIFADPERKAKIEAMHPLGRMGEPEDIAKAIGFLLSEDASWITGVVLPVDGGLACGHQHDI